MGMIGGNELGSLSGLVKTFQDKGLGDIVSSWVGTGKNLPISASQIQSAFGSEKLQSLAQKFGLPTDQVGEKLSQLLPTIIDKLTPNGKLPEA